MPAPTVEHGGFLVPNAKDVSVPAMAEPDRIDFNTIANARWGVVEGCRVLVSGTIATTIGGTAIVNGALIRVLAGSANMGVGGTQDRFDAIVTDTNGSVKVIPGRAATDPVFPDIPSNTTLLAAVFCPAGSGDFSSNVMDKRKLLSDSLLTKLPASSPLIYNLNGGAGALFSITGQGIINWNEDVQLFRDSPATLRLTQHLKVDGNLDTGGGITTASLWARGRVTGVNLLQGADPEPVKGTPGALYQGTDGRVYVWAKGEGMADFKWMEIALVDGIVPVGAVIQSLEGPEKMRPKGWVPLNGQNINEQEFPRLFTVSALQQFIVATTPRTMALPDSSRRVLLTDWGEAGKTGGSNTTLIQLRHMPAHRHNPRTTPAGRQVINFRTGAAGSHAHNTWGGDHYHGIDDPGHVHPGTDFFGHHLNYIVMMIGAKNTLDADFNDRSHTYKVDGVAQTGWGTTGITQTAWGGGHGHAMDAQGSHEHPVTADPISDHIHDVNEDSMGGGEQFDSTPAFLTVYSYVRS